MMRLHVLLPSHKLVEEEVVKINAEDGNGHFCLLPRHIDIATGLVPGILSFVRRSDNTEEFLAVDEGALVKCGSEVTVSTRHAIRGGTLGQLKKRVEEEFLALDEQDRKARSALARLEADFIRRYLELGR